MAIPINYIEIRFFAHATEDVEKVVEAVKHIFPARFAEEITFKRSKLEGYYGNPIIAFETSIKDKDFIKAFVENLVLNLSPLEKESLLNGMERCFDKGSLYIRLDKQAAFSGEVRLYEADSIHLRLRFSKNKLEDVKRICRDLGIIP